jgi:hypothetical protein
MPKDIDEDLIEATIRRVAESRAARTTDTLTPIEMPVSEAVAPVFGNAAESADDLASAATAEVAVEQEIDDDEDIAVTPPPPMPRLQPRPMPMQAPAVAIAMPQHPQDVGAQLQAIAERLDAVLPLLERIAAGAPGAHVGGEWDREPQSRAPISMAQRAAPARDGAAVAERAAPDVIDTRPLPKPLPPLVEPKRGFDLLPRNYRITVEDRRGGVDLVPLHRAMLGMEGVRDMSLLSYNNGVAIVALETTDELDPEAMRTSVARAMQCDARVEVHNESTMVVKLNEE